MNIIEHSALRPKGYVTITDDSGIIEADTLQCVHCGAHWEVVRGSGRIRGFCVNCNGVTCGSEKCMTCLPFEKRITLYEQGKIKNL